MKQLIETSDLVLLSWVQALLKDSDIESYVFDANMGQMGWDILFRQRVMVADEDLFRARRLLDEAQIEYEKK